MKQYKITFVNGKTLTLSNAIVDTEQRLVLVKISDDGENYYDYYPFENIIKIENLKNKQR